MFNVALYWPHNLDTQILSAGEAHTLCSKFTNVTLRGNVKYHQGSRQLKEVLSIMFSLQNRQTMGNREISSFSKGSS